MIQFSNPRLVAVIEDYPLGGSKRGTATYRVEVDAKKGQRVSRVTTGKAKFTTYGTRCAIVDGSNGRTYVLQESKTWGHSIRVILSDLMHDATADMGGRTAYFRSEVIHADQGGEEAQAEHAMFRTLLALIEAAQASHSVKATPGSV